MKCRNCNCAKRGYFASVPEAYVCTGVKEPFVIANYPDAECTEYKDENIKSTINDGIYIELFLDNFRLQQFCCLDVFLKFNFLLSNLFSVFIWSMSY